MKKLLCAALIALCAAASLAAQQVTDTPALSEINLLDINKYSSYFLDARKELDIKYILATTDEDFDRFSVLGGNVIDVDIPLEISLLSYYSQPVLNIRPVEAKNILPANNKTSELKLGAAVYQEMQMLRFLGNTDAVGRHEGILTFITDRGNVSGSEIQQYLIDGISAEVDKQFKNTSLPPAETQAVKDILTAFFIRPHTGTFNAVRDVEFIFMARVLGLSGEKKKVYTDGRDAYDSTISSLNPSLSGRVIIDISNDFRLKSGTDNVVDLAKLVR